MLVRLECSAAHTVNHVWPFCRLMMLGELSQRGLNHSDEFHQGKAQSFMMLMIDVCWVAV